VVDPEGSHWVRFVVTRVPPAAEKPHGIDYALTLHGPGKTTAIGCERSGPRDTRTRRLCWQTFGRGYDVARKRSDPMTTLKVGIARYEEMKAPTMAVARGERRVAANEPKVWFTSTESFAKVLSVGNRVAAGHC
jgi:hypothetical protein